MEEITRGMEMTAEECSALEALLLQTPQDTSVRTRLLGYYTSGMFASQELRRERTRHALWLIEFDPASEIAGSAFCQLGDGSDADLRARQVWREHLGAHPQDAAIHAHAARYFQYIDPALAEGLIEQARRLAPSATWELLDVAQLARGAPGACRTDARNPLQANMDRVRSALKGGELGAAEEEARRLLSAVEDNASGDGDAIYLAHHTIGLAELSRGDEVKACQSLLDAGQTPGSAVLAAFGPEMSLAARLLAAGHRDCVLEFLARAHRFWSMGHAIIDAWTRVIQDGGTPDFSRNVRH